MQQVKAAAKPWSRMKKTILILCCFFYLQLNAQTVNETPVQPPAGIPAEQDSIDV